MEDANPEVDESLEAQRIELLAPLWEAEGQPFGSQSQERWEGLTQWMKEAGLLKESVDGSEAFTP